MELEGPHVRCPPLCALASVDQFSGFPTECLGTRRTLSHPDSTHLQYAYFKMLTSIFGRFSSVGFGASIYHVVVDHPVHR